MKLCKFYLSCLVSEVQTLTTSFGYDGNIYCLELDAFIISLLNSFSIRNLTFLSVTHHITGFIFFTILILSAVCMTFRFQDASCQTFTYTKKIKPETSCQNMLSRLQLVREVQGYVDWHIHVHDLDLTSFYSHEYGWFLKACILWIEIS